MTAGPGHGTYTRLFAHPIGEGGIEYLDEDPAHILFDPFIEQITEEPAPLVCWYRERCQHHIFLLICRGGQLQGRIVIPSDSFHDGGKLNVTAIDLLEETVKLQRVVHVVIVHYCQAVELHAVLLQQFYAAHHPDEGGAPHLVAPVLIVKLLWSVDRDPHQEVVLFEKATPIIIQ